MRCALWHQPWLRAEWGLTASSAQVRQESPRLNCAEGTKSTGLRDVCTVCEWSAEGAPFPQRPFTSAVTHDGLFQKRGMLVLVNEMIVT